MKHHIETHLNSFQLCPICSVSFKTRRTLKTHLSRVHHATPELDTTKGVGGGGGGDGGGGGGLLVLEYPAAKGEQDENTNPFEPKIELTSE